MEPPGRKGVLGERPPQGDKYRMIRVPFFTIGKHRVPCLDVGEALWVVAGATVLIGEIIGRAHKGIEAVDRGLKFIWNEPRADREILIVALGEARAVSIRLLFRPRALERFDDGRRKSRSFKGDVRQ